MIHIPPHSYSPKEGEPPYVLASQYSFSTPITGYRVDLDHRATLYSGGLLTVRKGFRWDLASGAIDTPAMVRASLAHDVFCIMTDLGLIPWTERATSDVYFRELLKEGGESWVRRQYSYLAVSLYSALKGIKR